MKARTIIDGLADWSPGWAQYASRCLLDLAKTYSQPTMASRATLADGRHWPVLSGFVKVFPKHKRLVFDLNEELEKMAMKLIQKLEGPELSDLDWTQEELDDRWLKQVDTLDRLVAPLLKLVDATAYTAFCLERGLEVDWL